MPESFSDSNTDNLFLSNMVINFVILLNVINAMCLKKIQLETFQATKCHVEEILLVE